MARPLYFLSGPTAVGKTRLSLQWAQALNAEIISCDAVQFYRGLDIGSAKASKAEQTQIRHHFLDIQPPDQPYTVGDFQRDVRPLIESLHRAGKNVLITGGSGFYLSSFFLPLTQVPAPSPEIRQEVRHLLATEGLAALADRLLGIDPEAGQQIDLRNPVRVARALERCLTTGQSLAAQKQKQETATTGWEDHSRHMVLLSRPREVLHQRAAVRVRQMIADGLLQEVRRLREQGLENNPSAARAIGYRETLAYLKGDLSGPEEWEDAIITSTRRLIRKQDTWFRRFFPEAWATRIDLESTEKPLERISKVVRP
ncbi:MAG: tRNA (adenosine(37)-N6)-dimethylallyltransferase MiaA [Opitutales bacterium]|nr:tRNA (adenosine(37)-N6)-dimethylallyltransferase MiaA [Opitutales bacterium]